MYTLVSNIVDHVWIQNGSGDQQYIYFTACSIVILFSLFLLDLIGQLIHRLVLKGGGR